MHSRTFSLSFSYFQDLPIWIGCVNRGVERLLVFFSRSSSEWRTKWNAFDYLIHKGIESSYIVVVCRHRNWSTISFAYTANKAQHQWQRWRQKNAHVFRVHLLWSQHREKKVHKTRSTRRQTKHRYGFWLKRSWMKRKKKSAKCKQTKRANDQKESISGTRFASSHQYTCSSHVNITVVVIGATIFCCFSLNRSALHFDRVLLRLVYSSKQTDPFK